MPQFIGRPNIPYSAFERKDEPSTAQAIIQALSGILGTQVQAQNDFRKRKADLDEKKELLDYQLQAEKLKQKERDLADMVQDRLKQGGELGETAAPQQMSMQPQSFMQGLQRPDFVQSLSAGVRPSAPAGALRIPDLRRVLGLPEDLPSSRQYLTAGKGKAVDPLEKEEKELDVALKRKRLKDATGSGKEISELLRARGQLVSQMNNNNTDGASREALESQIAEINDSLGKMGIKGFGVDLDKDLADAKDYVRRGKITPEEAQARLSKKYPGLAEAFTVEKDAWWKFW